MKRKQYHLTEKQIAQLEQLAQDTGLTATEHVRRAIDEYLEKRHVSQLPVPPVSE